MKKEVLPVAIIRPSSDLRNHYSEISRQCREEKQPVFITVNGRGDTVVMGMAYYRQMQAKLELLQILAEGEEDVRMGRVAPMEESFDRIEKRLAEEFGKK